MRKSQFWDIKTIIILLVVFLVLFFLTKGIAQHYIDSGSSKICLLSVIAKSNTRGSPTDTISLECYTDFFGEIEPEGRTQKERDGYTMRQISSLLYECWMQFGEGEYDVFEGDMSDKAGHCFICSKFSVAGDIAQQQLLDTLKKENIGKSGKTYYHFLYDGLFWAEDRQNSVSPILFVDELSLERLDSGSAIDGFFRSLKQGLEQGKEYSYEQVSDILLSAAEPESFDKIHGQQPYSVVYLQISNEYWKQLWITRMTGTLGEYLLRSVGINIDLIKDMPPPARIIIAKYDKIKDLGCEMLQG
jgi:hypothetical protein